VVERRDTRRQDIGYVCRVISNPSSKRFVEHAAAQHVPRFATTSTVLNLLNCTQTF
jgi:hypothetical protein